MISSFSFRKQDIKIKFYFVLLFLHIGIIRSLGSEEVSRKRENST